MVELVWVAGPGRVLKVSSKGECDFFVDFDFDKMTLLTYDEKFTEDNSLKYRNFISTVAPSNAKAADAYVQSVRPHSGGEPSSGA